MSQRYYSDILVYNSDKDILTCIDVLFSISFRRERDVVQR